MCHKIHGVEWNKCLNVKSRLLSWENIAEIYTDRNDISNWIYGDTFGRTFMFALSLGVCMIYVYVRIYKKKHLCTWFRTRWRYVLISENYLYFIMEIYIIMCTHQRDMYGLRLKFLLEVDKLPSGLVIYIYIYIDITLKRAKNISLAIPIL